MRTPNGVWGGGFGGRGEAPPPNGIGGPGGRAEPFPPAALRFRGCHKVKTPARLEY